MSEREVLGKISTADFCKLYPDGFAIKRRGANKLSGKVPVHDLYVTIGKNSVLMHSEREQAELKKHLTIKPAPVAKPQEKRVDIEEQNLNESAAPGVKSEAKKPVEKSAPVAKKTFLQQLEEAL